MKEEKKPSPSQKLRFAIYKHWCFDQENMDFEEYYLKKMNDLIDAIYNKLYSKQTNH